MTTIRLSNKGDFGFQLIGRTEEGYPVYGRPVGNLCPWESLGYDIARAFDGQNKNIDRVWRMIFDEWD